MMQIIGKHRFGIFAAVLMVLFGTRINAQNVENDFQSRFEFQTELKLTKGLKLYASPELRLDEHFQASEFLFDLKTVYSPQKNIDMGVAYRLVADLSGNTVDYSSRFALDASYGVKINRFKPSLRIKYTNYSEEKLSGELLCYRARLGYNIKKCKISPELEVEAFQQLSNSDFYKTRYYLGAGYKLNKNNSVSVGYKFDYYLNKHKNKHIISVGYSYKF